MSTYLSYSTQWLEKHNAIHTAKEICQQPDIWQQVWQQLEQQTDWQQFLRPLLADPDLTIILTGAGSSAFVGSTLAPWLREQTKLNVQAYGTTEIVASPKQYLLPHCKTLMISYARSGNSPESVAAVHLANELIDDCYHLFITCNPNSALTDLVQNSDRVHELVMPNGTHDLSFAMTSSVSSMMLATIITISHTFNPVKKQQVSEISTICTEQLTMWQMLTKQLAKQSYQRIVYVGSGCFTGLAQETALKVLELTAGKIATRYDSTLGLRHGPKFIIDNNTLVVCFLSNDQYTRQYDYDLFNELCHDNIARNVLAVSGLSAQSDNILSLNFIGNDIWLVFPYLLFGQMLGFETSLALEFGPDNPCPTGEVNRVVKGVTIYPLTDKS